MFFAAIKADVSSIFTLIDTDKYYLKITHPEEVANSIGGSEQMGVTLENLFIPCKCNHDIDHVIILTDQSVLNNDQMFLKASKNDIILRNTPKIERALLKRRRRKCGYREPLLTEQSLETIYDFILYKINREQKARFRR